MSNTGELDPSAVRPRNGAESAVLRAERRVETDVDDNERRLRFLNDNVPTIMLYQVVMGADGVKRFSYVSAGVEQMHGLLVDEVMADASGLYGQIVEEDRLRVLEAEERSRRDHKPFEVEMRSQTKDGLRWFMLRSAPRALPDGGTVWDGVEIDITAAKQQEAERTRLEESLRHAQRMESVGRLAGGVAHDFNNMLTAIMGNLAMVRMELPDENPLCEMLDEASSAARAAENLTRQLLAFSRKQVVLPRIISLNDVTERMLKMLSRVLGEDVRLATTLDPDLAMTRADPGQIEQVIVNLAVNARDAMPSGGELTLGTKNVYVDGSRAARLELKPGPYVMLSTKDDGTGMSPEVLSRLFEPFFTTKGIGKGTGLGLAMVYGVVKQSGGGIEVTSVLGEGTEFLIYLPVVSPTEDSAGSARPAALQRGTETVLVVEDEPLVRTLARTILERQGYRVLTCADGSEALKALADPANARVDLLLTDLVMPGMSGRELAERVLAQRPGLQVLYTSGYSEDSELTQSIVDHPTHFLGKPYTVAELSRRVRELLDTKAP